MTSNLTIRAKSGMFFEKFTTPMHQQKALGSTLSESKLLVEHRRPGRNGKVLISEANERLCLSRTRTLSQEGYYVTSVSNVKEATEAAKRQSYELLIIRLEEPELLNMLLAQFPPEMSVLIITTKDIISEIAECSGAGIHSFLIQPFSVNRFKDRVAQIIDRAHLVKEGFRSEILTDLEHTNRLLDSQAEIDQFFKLVVEICAASTKADYVSLAIKDEATGKSVIKAQLGDHKPAWGKICQHVMKIQEPVIFDEATQINSHLHRLMTESGISAMLHIPLVIKGDVIGAINHIKVTRRARFASSDLNFASILGWWSSIALDNARLFSSVQKQHLHLEKLLHEISLAQENERKRVAIEIHDGVAQWLVGATYDIKACSNLISELRFADLELELAKIRKTLQRSISELRRAIANLRPVPLEEAGLVAALHQAAEVLNEEGISCHTKVDGTLPKLTLAEESTTYWIVQEALTNIRKHSKASEVSLRIQFRDSTVSVEISDNGQGFNLNQVMNSATPLGHMGLLGMKERAELLGGYLSINSNPRKGTSISFTFPVSSQITMKTRYGDERIAYHQSAYS
ncbi:MAG: ATP-binding protein [Dehalococcoidales bacterium]